MTQLIVCNDICSLLSFEVNFLTNNNKIIFCRCLFKNQRITLWTLAYHFVTAKSDKRLSDLQKMAQMSNHPLNQLSLNKQTGYYNSRFSTQLLVLKFLWRWSL